MGKTLAFIQARMASTRLPNKILKNMNGLSVIEHLIARLKKSAHIDDVVVLTSTNTENQPLCNMLKENGIQFFRGSENDVLDRFYLANQYYQAENIVRITADSPFICPEIVDKLINEFDQNDAQYAFLSERFAEGVDCEIINAKTLDVISRKAKLASEREHVTLYIFNHLEDFKVIELQNETDDSGYRFTLDTLDDWQVINKMAEYFAENSTGVTYQDIKLYFDTHPDVFLINNHEIRNEGLAISLRKEQDKYD
jgi:spore coat polysaccharide biosynthesis protein SpsF (cytidylyltransferase family)